jgi:hypothetical protein
MARAPFWRQGMVGRKHPRRADQALDGLGSCNGLGVRKPNLGLDIAELAHEFGVLDHPRKVAHPTVNALFVTPFKSRANEVERFVSVHDRDHGGQEAHSHLRVVVTQDQGPRPRI